MSIIVLIYLTLNRKGPSQDSPAMKKRPRATFNKRPHSVSPSIPVRPRSPLGKTIGDRRCHSLSPSMEKPTIQKMSVAESSVSAPESHGGGSIVSDNNDLEQASIAEKTSVRAMASKLMRSMAGKKRDFLKQKKTLISLQNSVLELYATLREMEVRTDTKDDTLGEVRVLSVTGWPPHDLLLLVREDLDLPLNPDINGIFSLQILQQLSAQLNQIPEEVLGVGAELMARRIELLNLIRAKYRNNAKNAEWDAETEKLHRLLAGIAENLKSKVNYCIDLAKIPWLDRETMIKKIDRLQRENLVLQHKLEDYTKKDGDEGKECVAEGLTYHKCQSQKLAEDLAKERNARESLKEVVAAAESMLRVARGRIATLERQLKETRADLDAARRKHKDLEQLVNSPSQQKAYRHRETSYDARSRKLIEMSKTGEMTIETLSRQRDALELRFLKIIIVTFFYQQFWKLRSYKNVLRVKELRDAGDVVEKAAASREAELRARLDSLTAKMAEQEKNRAAAESRIPGYEVRIKELEEQLQIYRERSAKLIDIERKRCVEFLPSIETEPTDRETEIWTELQFTRAALATTEEELKQARADKDSFLNSLNKIAQVDGDDSIQDKMGAELVEREKKIAKLQNVIEQLKENEKTMKQDVTQYENQLTSLKMEVKRLRNYNCYSKEIPFQELQTELLDMHMQVDTLSRERNALVTAAASRALMLERHERAASLFARILKARRDLTALVEGGGSEPSSLDDSSNAEVSRSLSSVCGNAAETWTALQAERTRVLRLESAVLAQSLQLEREDRVRTQLERRRAVLEREVLRAHQSSSAEQCSSLNASRKNLNWPF
ncbi:cingulin-like isoform X4 [Plodia interpunctella]|uniref:cingulin-like isoform X4 n=1 Tax=Plodia interpunctella TaxID=58824 RepID=UPI0023686582|nr:cingulin-like isoform X4 [Plodia interpunctella]